MPRSKQLLNSSIKQLLLDGNPVGSCAGVLIPEHTRLVMHSWPVVLAPEAQLHPDIEAVSRLSVPPNTTNFVSWIPLLIQGTP